MKSYLFSRFTRRQFLGLSAAAAAGLALSYPVFILHGIGWGTLLVRLNCPPEIAVLRLVRA